jgi:predicted enzyme related to lactoylglutathione lyase
MAMVPGHAVWTARIPGQGRHAVPQGHFSWNELLTTDVEAAKTFFATTLCWSYEAMPTPFGGTYWIARCGGTPVAGVMAMPPSMPSGTPSHWLPYLTVDDVDAFIGQAVSAGGSVCMPPFDIPAVGRIGVIADPTGAVVALITPVATAAAT